MKKKDLKPIEYTELHLKKEGIFYRLVLDNDYYLWLDVKDSISGILTYNKDRFAASKLLDHPKSITLYLGTTTATFYISDRETSNNTFWLIDGSNKTEDELISILDNFIANNGNKHIIFSMP